MHLLCAKVTNPLFVLHQALQAATNVALDLESRPMPKIITLPRYPIPLTKSLESHQL